MRKYIIGIVIAALFITKTYGETSLEMPQEEMCSLSNYDSCQTPCNPCDPCAPCAPCAPSCGVSACYTAATIGVALLLVAGVAAVVLASGDAKSAHS